MKTTDTWLLRGGRVIDPGSGFDQTADVVVSDGTVVQISTDGTAGVSDGDTVFDAEGCIVCPGLLDIHVHLREPSDGAHEETIATGSAAALAGGFTTVCCMPNTTPALDGAAAITQQLELALQAKHARVYPVGCATIGRKGQTLAPIADMVKAGAIAISDDGDVVESAAMMQRALIESHKADVPFMQHCQEPSLTKGATMNAGAVADAMGQVGWPKLAEELIIERDIMLNRDIGCRYHAQHISSGESVNLLQHAQQAGQPVTGECSPHHLLLTDEACKGPNTNAKMNPPLRTQADIDQLKEGIARGVITILATDHAPHPRARKNVPFAEAAFGIVGLECALALYARALIENGPLDWPAMLAMMTSHPARLVRLNARGLGTLREGGVADITVIDPDDPWTIDSGRFQSTGRNCPFDGWAVRGRAVASIVGGQMRYHDQPGRIARGVE
jgi:dihydroorotase